MATMTDAELAAIEVRAEAATAGPWRVTARGDVDSHTGKVVAADERGNVMADGDDLAFIAASRIDVPALVAEVRRLTAALAAADALADAAWQDIHDGEAAPLHAQLATRVTLADYDKARGRVRR
jgi:hypothetical protein